MKQYIIMAISMVALVAAIIGFCLILPAQSAPWLVCDPQTGVTSYQFSGDSFFTTKTAEADGSLRYDLVGLTNGSHTIQVVACNTLWGCSTATPFTFTKGAPASPLNIRIIAVLP